MSAPCKVCNDKKRKEIDEQLKNDVPVARIAKNFGIGRKSVQNHWNNHVKPLLEKDCDAPKVDGYVFLDVPENFMTLPVMEKLQWLQKITFNMLFSGQYWQKEKIEMVKEFRAQLGEEAKLLGLYQKKAENRDALEKAAENVLRAHKLYPTASIERLIEVGATDNKLDLNSLRKKVRDLQSDQIATAPAVQ